MFDYLPIKWILNDPMDNMAITKHFLKDNLKCIIYIVLEVPLVTKVYEVQSPQIIFL